MIGNNDIIFVLSGGSDNQDPNASLGDELSSHPILGLLNNLFDNVSSDETKSGNTDYRCLYIFNNNEHFDFYNTKIYIESETTGGSTIEIGVIKNTEIQRITILANGNIVGGSYTISFNGHNVLVPHDSDLGTWGQSLQDGLNNLNDLSGVAVNSSVANNAFIFDIKFQGDDDNRSQPLIELVSNHLLGTASIIISRISSGSPINAIAPSIDFDIQSPFGVTFFAASKTDPIQVGSLKATEGMSVWIKRTTTINVEAISNDGVSLQITGSPIP